LTTKLHYQEHSVQWHLDEPGGVHGDRPPGQQPGQCLLTTWYGTSYLMPIFGAIVTDTFFVISLAIYLLVRTSYSSIFMV
jgi:hypothetical protein